MDGDLTLLHVSMLPHPGRAAQPVRPGLKDSLVKKAVYKASQALASLGIPGVMPWLG